MNMNVYALEQLVASRLEQLRADAARSRLLASLPRRPVGVRAALAAALVRARRRMGRRVIVNPRPA